MEGYIYYSMNVNKRWIMHGCPTAAKIDIITKGLAEKVLEWLSGNKVVAIKLWLVKFETIGLLQTSAIQATVFYTIKCTARTKIVCFTIVLKF